MSKQVVDMNSTEFQPRMDCVLIKPQEIQEEKITEAGIFIPRPQNSVLDRPTSGVVIAVGSEVQDIQEDTIVLWPTENGVDFEFNDGDFILIREKSIIGMKK